MTGERDEDAPRLRPGADATTERLRDDIAELYGLDRADVELRWTSDWSVTVEVRFPPDVRYAHLAVVSSTLPAPGADEQPGADAMRSGPAPGCSDTCKRSRRPISSCRCPAGPSCRHGKLAAQ